MKKLNKKGFTIVELVIVIAVIAILAAVLIPTFATVVEKANKSSAQQQAKNFFTLLEAATAAPTTYKAEGTKTYTLRLQNTGLLVSKSGDGNNVYAEVILYNVLGDDVKTYNGAKVGIATSTNLNTGAEWTITAVYFQPKNSAYCSKIDLVNGTVEEAVKASEITGVSFCTFDGTDDKTN